MSDKLLKEMFKAGGVAVEFVDCTERLPDPVGYVSMPHPEREGYRIVGLIFKDRWPLAKDLKRAYRQAQKEQSGA